MPVLSKLQYDTMIGLQEAMNCRVTKAWREENYCWLDAIWTEAAEAFNHLPWPWWKGEGAKANIPAIKLELVDIWHFLLSQIMMHDSFFTEIESSSYEFVTEATSVADEVLGSMTIDKQDFQKRVLKGIIEASTSILDAEEEADPRFRLGQIFVGFYLALHAFDMTWDDLYKMYVGKNTLNRFRQDHGYKTDTQAYKFKWLPLEDNDYLTGVVNSLDVSSDTFKEDIYASLETEWKKADEEKVAA